MSKLHPMFVALVRKSCQIGWPAAYKNDLLVHDRHTIETLNPQSFGWLVRECGTELLLVNNAYAFQVLHYHMYNTPSRAFWCNMFMGKPEISEVTPLKLWDMLYNRAHRRLQAFVDWSKRPNDLQHFNSTTHAARVQREVDELLKVA